MTASLDGGSVTVLQPLDGPDLPQTFAFTWGRTRSNMLFWTTADPSGEPTTSLPTRE